MAWPLAVEVDQDTTNTVLGIQEALAVASLEVEASLEEVCHGAGAYQDAYHEEAYHEAAYREEEACLEVAAFHVEEACPLEAYHVEQAYRGVENEVDNLAVEILEAWILEIRHMLEEVMLMEIQGADWNLANYSRFSYFLLSQIEIRPVFRSYHILQIPWILYQVLH